MGNKSSVSVLDFRNAILSGPFAWQQWATRFGVLLSYLLGSLLCKLWFNGLRRMLDSWRKMIWRSRWLQARSSDLLSLDLNPDICSPQSRFKSWSSITTRNHLRFEVSQLLNLLLHPLDAIIMALPHENTILTSSFCFLCQRLLTLFTNFYFYGWIWHFIYWF